MKKLYFSSFLLFCFIIFITCITTFVVYSNQSFTTSSTDYYFSNTDYSWPLPEHNTISSYFGFRISPTSGTSTYHSGIDIPAPEGTAIYAASSGTVHFLGFDGANGYTVIVQNDHLTFSYSHISPDFLVNIGDTVIQNQPIATVGPKYISAIPNHPYTDSSRQTNKWSNNWLSSAFWRKNRWHCHRST